MKKLILAGLVALQGMALAQVPTTGLIGRWEFNNNFSDGSPSVNNGSSTSPPTFIADRCNTANSACHFNGTTNYIQMISPGPAGSVARSLSFWLRTTNSTVWSPRVAFDYGTATGIGDSWQMVYNYCAAGIGLDVSNQAVIKGGACLSDGNWHHIVAVYSAVSTIYSNTDFYVDGVLQAINCNVSGLSQNVNTGSTYPVTIGRGATSAVRYWDGDLDDFYFYNRALTATEVQQLYNATNCGITSSPCFCNNSKIFTTPPVSGATSYAWTLPSGWSGVPSGNTNYVTATSTLGGVVTVNISTSCGGVLTRTVAATYCNNAGNSLTLTAGNVTICTNSVTATTATITSNNSGTTYNWLPGSLTGSMVTVSPTVTTVYTVTANNPDFCTTVKEVTVTVVDNCCTQTVTPDTRILSGTVSGPYISGLYLINSNVTLTGNTNFANSVFMMMPNVQITVPAGFNLNLDGSHLYACGLKMWQGITVQDAGSITSSTTYNNSTLVEDAIVAVDLSNITPSHVSPPINMSDVTFNKNYIGIKISNANPPVSTLPISLKGCVFSSRNLPFTASSWPSASISGLRFAAAGATAGIVPPYLLQSYPQASLKMPYTNQGSYAGIKIDNIANIPGSLTSAGVDIGVTYAGTYKEFNLFDGLGVGIDVTDASLTTINNVFQNMKYNQAIPGMSGSGIEHRIVSSINMNARLDLRPVAAGSQSTNFGNRFWDCYTGIHTDHIFEFYITYGIFRSDQKNTVTGFLPGNTGMLLETNRFDYLIQYNEFNNLNYGIKSINTAGPYNINNNPQNGIYTANLVIQQNYFGPQVASSTPLANEFSGDAIHITGPNAPVYQTAPTGGTGNIISNKIDRSYRGISINSMFNYPINILNNSVYLFDDVVFALTQYGIEAFDNMGNLVVGDNTLSSVGTSNGRLTLVYCRNNLGASSPIVSCNHLSNSYQGFEFNGNNSGALWLGNDMTTHQRGLVLSNNGIIGTQGSPSLGSGNRWLGTWSGPNFSTWCDNSNASSSVLYVFPAASFIPTSNNGSGSFTPYSLGTSIITTKKANYKCASPTYPSLPSQKPADVTGIKTEAFNGTGAVEVYPNPSQGKITIVGKTENEQLFCTVIDITGKVVLTASPVTNGFEATLNLDLQKGIYLIDIRTSDNKTSHKKLVIE